ncbi:rab11 family-interacting protein 1 [Alligator sinensis]|uniref:Rab11 family-interacting protein 1 n=1 Tax=Alligator sinensis TaxID=38654 RepID=A0A3Q0GIA7_ALLSI|nr:rab11 family-interacting protein 1 [Alligator sinensis]
MELHKQQAAAHRSFGLSPCRADGWYKLHSKPGKKEKERGEIEVDIQFMRSNLTASMFDLSMKDKSRSTFGKLKDKLKGKRSSGLSDTVSAIVPSITHSIADSEDESAEKEKKKFKIKTLFSKPGLQKSSLSQSMSALPAVQPVTEKVKLRPGDFKSSWYDNDDDEEDEKTLTPVSEKNFDGKAEDTTLHPPAITAYKKTASVDKQLNQAASSSTKKEGLSLFGGLKSKNDPVSRSNVCINGSHVYMEECEAMPKDSTPSSSPSPQTFRKKHLYASEENLSSKSVKGPEELEKTNRALSGSSSLETFKSLTLPSYKLLSGGDSIESSVPSSADSTKETKKPALLSLVTGKKELGKNTDVEKLTDVTVKEKDVKGPENQKNESKAKPIEVLTALPRESPSESSSTAYVPRNKQSLNPFGEEQKPEKPVASARTNQTKVVKPRPHPVKPMNTTPKSFSITSSVTEKRTEINPKKYDPSDPAYAYAQLTHDELIQLVLKQKNVITKRDLQVRELEDYIDNLLVRVMEETPNILRVSSQINKKAGRM